MQVFANITMHFLMDTLKKSMNIKHLVRKRKKRAKCWLQPYITLSICLKRGFVPCGLNDLDPVIATTKTLGKLKNTDILKELFNFDLKKLQALIDFLKQTQ